MLFHIHPITATAWKDVNIKGKGWKEDAHNLLEKAAYVLQLQQRMASSIILTRPAVMYGQ